MSEGSFSVDIKAPQAQIYSAKLRGLSDRGVERALKSAVTFVAKDYTKLKADKITQDIDRPRSFSKRAYNWDGAKSGSREISARSYVRPKQARYLAINEFGGTRNRQSGRGGPISIKADMADRYGGGWGKDGFKRRWLDKSAAKIASGAGRRKDGTYRVGTKMFAAFKIGDKAGIWMKVKLSKAETKARRNQPGKRFGGTMNAGWKTYLVVGFLKTANYDNPSLNFRKDALSFGTAQLPRTAKRLLDREIEKLAS